ncbi:MAG: peroxiredoxin family protein [bacterium]
MKQYFRVVTVISICVLMFGCSMAHHKRSGSQHSLIGKKAPLFTLGTINGNTIKLSDYLGQKFMVLNFFGTWCPPCRAELPALEDLYRNNRQQVILIGISLNEKASSVRTFMDEIDLNFPVIMDPSNNTSSVSTRYNVPTLPTTVLINPRGKVIFYKPGMLQNYDFEHLKTLINKESLAG